MSGSGRAVTSYHWVALLLEVAVRVTVPRRWRHLPQIEGRRVATLWGVWDWLRWAVVMGGNTALLRPFAAGPPPTEFRLTDDTQIRTGTDSGNPTV